MFSGNLPGLLKINIHTEISIENQCNITREQKHDSEFSISVYSS